MENNVNDHHIHIDELVEKVKKVLESKDENGNKPNDVYIFNDDEVKVLKKIIRLVEFFNMFGSVGQVVLKIALWGTGMLGAWSVYSKFFMGGE